MRVNADARSNYKRDLEGKTGMNPRKAVIIYEDEQWGAFGNYTTAPRLVRG